MTEKPCKQTPAASGSRRPRRIESGSASSEETRSFMRVKGAARRLWFKHYPAMQTLAAFALALLATCAFSLNPTTVSNGDVLMVDPHAQGAYFICLEVLMSFAGHVDAVVLLSLTCLLTLPFRYVFFGRRDSIRPSVVIPAAAFAIVMTVGKSYDLTNGADLIFKSHAYFVDSCIATVGWYLLAHIGFYLIYECLDWMSLHFVEFSESRYGRVWQLADFIFNRHPFVIPLAVIVFCWAPTFIASMPGLFMGDTGAQIRQWFNYPEGTSDYLNLIDPNVRLNGHHPVVHTALVGSCVQLGITLFNNENVGVFIYTVLQFSVTALCVAYLICTLTKLKCGMVARSTVLMFYLFMPMFSNYAVLLTKDVLFADFLLLLVIQMVRLISTRVHFAWHDWLLFCVGALGTAFFRNGGVALVLVACAASAVVCAFDLRRLRVAARWTKGRGVPKDGAVEDGAAEDGVVCELADADKVSENPGSFDAEMASVAADASSSVHPSLGFLRLRVMGPLAILAVAAALSWAFSNVFMPAYHITPGSKREVLSVPFQMTARFVQKHDGRHSGLPRGNDDGLVTPEEREAIDRVLRYSDLGLRYDPDRADAVKNCYNEDASPKDIREYFHVWAEMFSKDPESYVSAFINNYYGYFYPSSKDVWTYGTAFSAEVMASQENRTYFDFRPYDAPVVHFFNMVVNIYRVAIQRIPLLSLFMCSATYVWLMILVTIYLLRNREWRSISIWIPLWAVLGICLIGPCNGSTYMRYIYPVLFIVPFVAAVTVTWPRPVSKPRI